MLNRCAVERGPEYRDAGFPKIYSQRVKSINIKTKRDLSISMLRANVLAFVIGIPVAIVQLTLFVILHGALELKVTSDGLPNVLLFFMILLVSIVVHEFIHGLTWKIVANKTSTTITYGVQWKTLTLYAHVNEPLNVNVYRIGGFMPGFVLGIIPYLLSLLLGDTALLVFGIIHTFAAGGDWLILWLLRNLNRETLVQDHPSRAGCYVVGG